MNFRIIIPDDYENLVIFWKENYFVSEMDIRERFALFLDKNPDLSVLAEEDGKIVGSALGSFDGRRGYLQKVVTEKSARRHGIGKALVEEVLKRLKKLGVLYIPIAVEEEYVEFYKKCGFKVTKQIPMNMDL